MKSFDEFNKLVDKLVVNKFPLDIDLFMGDNEYNETMDFLKGISSSATVMATHPHHSDMLVERISYAGYRFNIIKY